METTYHQCPECDYVYEVEVMPTGQAFANGMLPIEEDNYGYVFEVHPPTHNRECSTDLLVRK